MHLSEPLESFIISPKNNDVINSNTVTFRQLSIQPPLGQRITSLQLPSASSSSRPKKELHPYEWSSPVYKSKSILQKKLENYEKLKKIRNIESQIMLTAAGRRAAQGLISQAAADIAPIEIQKLTDINMGDSDFTVLEKLEENQTTNESDIFIQRVSAHNRGATARNKKGDILGTHRSKRGFEGSYPILTPLNSDELLYITGNLTISQEEEI